MELCFAVSAENTTGAISLRDDAAVQRIVAAWPEARIVSISITGLFAADDDLVVAALTPSPVAGRSLALARGLVTTRSSDTSSASTNSGPVPAGVDPELRGPLTVGSAAHLCWLASLNSVSWGVIRLQVQPGGTAVFDALVAPVAASSRRSE